MYGELKGALPAGKAVPLTAVDISLSGAMAKVPLMNITIETSEAGAIPSSYDRKQSTDNTDAEVPSNQILGHTRDNKVVQFSGPAPYVILHHSYQPGVCRTEDACKAAMRSMQNFHMDKQGWSDIGYSFAVGGDGNVYEGRGYEVVGAHAPNYNSRSIGLLLIGNFMEEQPPAPMQQVAQDFIKYSVEAGHLREDYILHGHRQVRNTLCPGDALYAAVKQCMGFMRLD
ncbi:peptidoglycan-recognition protein SB1-like [Rhagoletis pomonella]|uniref:peptidoglycan-recognition protein SB1-like n=1 Tax=Rhagoletis pomonella TaxID=28610 RepID=UPI00177E5DAB|nr:peptidoglycan-recognition protein SB1-like [Rhagoletis pomonella]